MKTKYQQLSRIMSIIAVVALLVGSMVKADNIYVSAYGSGTIEKFDSAGNKTTFAFGLSMPTGLTFDNSGNLYVASGSASGIIDIFDSSGNKTNFASGLKSPQALAFGSSGNLYASEYGNDYISKFNLSGNKSVFGNIDNPEGLAFDSSGFLYAGSQRGGIYKFDSSGNGTTFAGGEAAIGLAFAFDESGYLYAANYYTGTIKKYDSVGNGVIFASGFTAPYGLTFDSSGYLYVGDMSAGTITKFDPSGNGTLFASGLSQPTFITSQVPEPTTLLLLGLGVVAARSRRRGC